jgi:hypothetical protein
MALFSFADLRFRTATRQGFGTNDRLLGNKTYNYDIARYPIDIGSADKGHYMVIHINAQRRTQFNATEVAGDEPTIIRNRRENGSPTIYSNVGNIFNAADSLSNGRLGGFINKLTQYSNISGGASGQDIITSGARTIKRTTETIALYMPDTLNFTYNQQYSDMTLTGGLASLLAGGASVVDALQKGGNTSESIQSVVQNLSPFVLNAVTQNSPLLRAGFAAVTGVVQNPILELLYSQPAFRTFRFEFMFYPRDEKEAQEVQRILEILRFHQAPEVLTEGQGFFLVPPSEFDIQFYYNGKENDNIPKISTCVLDTIDVDYAPNGFAAYEVPGQNVPSIGKTGMPVAIRLSLGFKETEILTKENYRKKNRSLGFSSDSEAPEIYGTSEGE